MTIPIGMKGIRSIVKLRGDLKIPKATHLTRTFSFGSFSSSFFKWFWSFSPQSSVEAVKGAK
jgi:hypothetical protein